MRKNIFQIICLLLAIQTTLTAQERRDLLLADFENQETFFTVVSSANLSMQVVPNPDKRGENTSDYVLKIEGSANHDNSWEALYTPNNKTTHQLTINNTDGYRYLHFKVRKNFTSGMLWAFYSDINEDGVLEQKLPNQIWNSQTDEWEYLVLDLLAATESWNISQGTYYRIDINMTKSMNPKAAFTAYIDDIFLSNSAQKTSSGSSSEGEWELMFEENFDGASVNQSNWYLYNSSGHAGNGLRRPEAFSVADGILTVTAQMKNGSLVSGGMSHRKNYTYGKFEFRVKADADPSGATSAVVLTWPQSEVWPDDGENDIFETHSSSNPNRNNFTTNILSGLPLNQWSKKTHYIDAKVWNIVAMEWGADTLRIVVNGEKAWELTNPDLIVDKPHHLCIQLDAFKTSMTGVSRMYVDWVKIYQKRQTATEAKVVKRQSSINISPNPVTDFLTIDWLGAQPSGTIDLFSVDGRFVRSIRANESEIDCSKLKSGLYFLRRSFNPNVEVIKFIKK